MLSILKNPTIIPGTYTDTVHQLIKLMIGKNVRIIPARSGGSTSVKDLIRLAPLPNGATEEDLIKYFHVGTHEQAHFYGGSDLSRSSKDKILFGIQNALEDTRCERLQEKEYPGLKPYRVMFYINTLKGTVGTELSNASTSNLISFINTLGKYIIVKTRRAQLNAPHIPCPASDDLIREYDKHVANLEQRIINLETFDEMLEVASIIYDRFKDAIRDELQRRKDAQPPSPPQPPQEDDSDDDTLSDDEGSAGASNDPSDDDKEPTPASGASNEDEPDEGEPENEPSNETPEDEGELNDQDNSNEPDSDDSDPEDGDRGAADDVEEPSDPNEPDQDDEGGVNYETPDEPPDGDQSDDPEGSGTGSGDENDPEDSDPDETEPGKTAPADDPNVPDSENDPSSSDDDRDPSEDDTGKPCPGEESPGSCVGTEDRDTSDRDPDDQDLIDALERALEEINTSDDDMNITDEVRKEIDETPVDDLPYFVDSTVQDIIGLNPSTSEAAALSIRDTGIRMIGAKGTQFTGLFISNTKPRTMRNRMQGRLDVQSFAADVHDIRDDVFTDISGAKLDKAAVTFLMDNSSSMKSHIQATYSIMSGMLHYLSRACIPTEVVGYTAAVSSSEVCRNAPAVLSIVKEFKEPYNSAVMRRCCPPYTMMNTNDLDGMKFAVPRLWARPEKKKIIMALCDGNPTIGSYPLDCKLRKAYKEYIAILRKAGIIVFGIGIQCDLSEYFGDDFADVGMNDIGGVLVTKLSGILNRPAMF